MRRLAILIVAVALIAACATSSQPKTAGADLLRNGTVTRLYSRQAPDLLLDWKYVPGRAGTPQVAEVLPSQELKLAPRGKE